MPTQVLIASNNPHKADEIQKLLGSDYLCLSLRDFPDAPPVVEDANTFAGNAVKKALSLVNWLKINNGKIEGWILADDSGLEVDALEGEPGIYSARYASDNNQNCSDEANNSKLLGKLKGIEPSQRTARFRCVIALAKIGEYAQPQIFNGICEGQISEAASGVNGFGYDPLFIPKNFNNSFGELDSEIKNLLSHRASALHQLKEWLTKN
ncbi:MAG TPA: non-canonical purine NTP pyrophosphatase, RdgB/HAM1 family [Verrucomicrobiales bacterium]|nr:non-canonical purine NTP pyrophosphatase, RdgB/HAM1 family [Verrucomicrobiales bacterium]|tara:strand:- start:1891 stop:2517 length:627 start_codon:yes stop_codon:yes gene_type:complete